MVSQKVDDLSPAHQQPMSNEMESMACGLPVVHTRPLWEKEPEVLGELGLIVELTPEGFRSGIRQLIDNPVLAKNLGGRARSRIEGMSGRLMEEKEYELYEEFLFTC